MDSVETYAAKQKDLLCKNEEIKYSSVIKQYKNDQL